MQLVIARVAVLQRYVLRGMGTMCRVLCTMYSVLVVVVVVVVVVVIVVVAIADPHHNPMPRSEF